MSSSHSAERHQADDDDTSDGDEHCDSSSSFAPRPKNTAQHQQQQQHNRRRSSIGSIGSTCNNGATMMDNDNHRSAELVTELLSITPTDDAEGFETLVEERQVRIRQLQICHELLQLVRRARDEREGSNRNNNNNKEGGDDDDDDPPRPSSADGPSFIRTSISDYRSSRLSNGGRRQEAEQPSQERQQQQQLRLRDLLGGLSSSTTSELASALARLVSHRVELESLLPGTQDVAANLEAMGIPVSSSQSQQMMGDGDDRIRNNGQGATNAESRRRSSSSSSAKAAMTISNLGLTSAQLYVELIGTKGAWGAGMIDVGGISAITALVRRWCVECRGREGVLLLNNNKKGNKGDRGKKGPPEKKRSKPTKSRQVGSRKSVRISEVVSVMNNDEDHTSDSDSDLGSNNNTPNNINDSTFQVVEETEDSDNIVPAELTEFGMVAGGLRLSLALSRPTLRLRAEYENWSPEAREFYADGAAAALGTASALLAGCSKSKKDEENADICREVVSSLERALRTTVTPKVPETMRGSGSGGGSSSPYGLMAPQLKMSGRSRSRRSSALRKKDAAAKQKLHESGIYLLRGLLPIFNLKLELPNGQSGKLAAYETVSSLLVNIITSISEDIELNNSRQSRMSISPKGGALNDSITPKRGGRKSIAFSHTPGTNKKNRRDTFGATPNTTLLAPPSLKKSITPRRTRNSISASSGPLALHPVLSLVMGMLQKLFTAKGLERAEARSRTCDLGITCLTYLPNLERNKLLKFVSSMCESKISSHRLLGVEIIGEVMCQSWFWKDNEKKASDKSDWNTPFLASGEKERQDESNTGKPGGNVSPSSALLAALQGRLTDKSPTVRTRAALSLGEAARKACSAQDEGRNLDGTVIASTPSKLTDNEASIPSKALTVALCKIGPSLVEALRNRACTDERATVRKSSIMAWLEMLHLARRENKEEFGVSGMDISALCQLCNDSSVATRKAAAEALTKLVMRANDNDINYAEDGEEDGDVSKEYSSQLQASLEIAWAHTVLPLVSDAEASCVMKAVEFFSMLVIEPIVELGEDAAEKLSDTLDDSAEGANDIWRYHLAWRILAKLSDASNEAGGSRNASGSLITVLQKLLINIGKDAKSLSKKLFLAVNHVGRFSLGLGVEGRSSSFLDNSSAISHIGVDEAERNLFNVNTTAMRAGVWCLLDALTSCLAHNNDTTTNCISRDSIKSSSLASISQTVRASKIDASFLASSLRKLRALMNSPEVPADKKRSLAATSRDCLRVIAKMGAFIPLEDARACFKDLLNDLESFTTLSIELVSAAVNALIALTKRMCDDDDGNVGLIKKDVFEEVEAWTDRLLHRCENAIESRFSSFAQRGAFNEADENLLLHVLYLVGEVCMIGFTSQEDSSRMGLNSITKRQKKDDDVSPTDREPVRGLLIRPPARLVHLVKLMLPNTMPMPSSSSAGDEQRDEEVLTPTPSGMRAHAFITLGKFCLRDKTLAKESLNILARELHQDANSDPAVQSNCLMVLGDLIIRYTNLTDKYLPFMAACLQAGDGRPAEVNASSRLSSSMYSNRKTNGHSMVKKNALLLLSSLLLQDYIKWRGLFIHRFLAAVADDDDEVSCLAQTALRGPLLAKQPNLLCNHFVGAVFVFNACKAHPLYATESSSGGGNGLAIDFEGHKLAGKEGYNRRREVYEMMLANMTDEQKLEVTARLVKEILGGALETTGDFSTVCKLSSDRIKSTIQSLSRDRIEAATNVLTDTLAILTSSEIKVGRKGGAEDADEEDDLASVNGANRPDQRRNIHKRRLLTKISRKHLMEIVIPILSNLKTVLEGSHSPLLKNLMRYLIYIYRSYKSEVREHLANNPTLLLELEYDMRQYEKEKQRKAREMDSSLLLQAEIVTDEGVAT